MKKFLRLSCTTCKRTIDKLVDNSHISPDKCTITYQCGGRLVPVQYLSNGQITAASASGVTDWHQRTTTETTVGPMVPEVSLINTATGSYGQLVLALALAVPPADSATARLELAVRTDTPKSFRQYTFRFDTTFASVAGVENGPEKKTLRFKAYGLDPDLIEVYLNGVKLERGTAADQFQINDGSASSSVPDNIVSFNSPVSLPGTTQVDVVVSKALAQTTKILTFVRNVDTPSRTFAGAWENVSFFERLVNGVWTRYYIFKFDILDTTAIDLNTIMSPYGDLIVNTGSGTITLPQTKACFMLARKPYSPLDRYLNLMVSLDTMSTDRDYLKYHVVSSTAVLDVTQSSVVAFYPPARLPLGSTGGRFDPDPIIAVTQKIVIGETEQLTIDGQLIVGPDA
jgi:hypothetical protein